MFLFDEDLGDAAEAARSSSKGKVPLPPAIVKDLIGFGTEELERSFGEISISIPKTGEGSFGFSYAWCRNAVPDDIVTLIRSFHVFFLQRTASSAHTDTCIARARGTSRLRLIQSFRSA